MTPAPFSTLVERVTSPASHAWDVGDRAFDQMRAGRDVIHLGVGDPDLDTPQTVRQALFDAVEDGRTHYAPIPGEPALRDAIAVHAARHYGGVISDGNVSVCAGAQAALFAAFLVLAGPGDDVIVLEPYYATYPAVVTAGGARMVTVPLDAAAGYPLDIDRIRAAMTERTRAVLINTPGNPTGAVYAREELTALARLCAARGVWLVSDEVYWSLSYDQAHSSPYHDEQTRETTIIVSSLSKSHAMTGWRLGWVIGPERFIGAMNTLGQALHFGVTQFVQDAAVVALADVTSPAEIREVFKRRRDALASGLAESQALRFTQPAGGMFVLADVSRCRTDGAGFANDLLDEAAVAVVPGFGFGTSATDSVRIGFLCDEGRLSEAARRVVHFADKRIT